MIIGVIYNENWERRVSQERIECLDREIFIMQKRMNYTYNGLKSIKLQARIDKCVKERDRLDDKLYVTPEICIISGVTKS
jgi:hypothetical protein